MTGIKALGYTWKKRDNSKSRAIPLLVDLMLFGKGRGTFPAELLSAAASDENPFPRPPLN